MMGYHLVVMKILITGVAGFVGWKTAEFLLAGGHEVIGIDNVNDYYDVRLKDWRLERLRGTPGFSFQRIDIESKETLRGLFQSSGSFDGVINLAARAGVRASIENPDVYYTTNVNGSLNILELVREYSVPKYVLASTSSLYAGHPLPFDESQPVNRPISPYAASKKAAEAMAFTWHHLYGIDTTVVRYFTVYGPAGRPDMSPLRFIRWIDEGTPITLYGDGSQTRDFTYVDDIARGTVAALKPVGFEIVNLGGGNRPVSIRSMIDSFAKLLGKDPLIDRHPFHTADMMDTQAVVEKAKSILEWEPMVTPNNGFQRTIEWYLQHRDWVRSLNF